MRQVRPFDAHALFDEGADLGGRPRADDRRGLHQRPAQARLQRQADDPPAEGCHGAVGVDAADAAQDGPRGVEGRLGRLFQQAGRAPAGQFQGEARQVGRADLRFGVLGQPRPRRLVHAPEGDAGAFAARAAHPLNARRLGLAHRHETADPASIVGARLAGEPRVDDDAHTRNRQRALGHGRAEDDAPGGASGCGRRPGRSRRGGGGRGEDAILRFGRHPPVEPFDDGAVQALQGGRDRPDLADAGEEDEDVARWRAIHRPTDGRRDVGEELPAHALGA